MNLTIRYGNHTREPYEYIEVEFETIFAVGVIDDPSIRTTYFNDEQWHERLIADAMHWKWDELSDVAEYIYGQLYSDAGDAGMSVDEIKWELKELTRQALFMRKLREVRGRGRNV